MLEWIKFEKACLAKAFTGKFWPIEKMSGGLAVIMLLLTKVLPLPEGVAAMVETDLPLYFFVSIFVMTVFVGYILAPYSLYKEQLDAKIRLDHQRKPALSIFIRETSAGLVKKGSTLQSLTGSRQTIFNGFGPDLLSVYCKNTGESKAKNCVARLVSAKQIQDGPDRELEIIESIVLPWDSSDPESNLVETIAPNGVCRIWIAGLTLSGDMWIFREMGRLPIEYQRFFGEAGKYEIVIQVDSDDSAPVQVKLEVSTKPRMEGGAGLHRGHAQISILAQGSPTLPQLGTAT